MRHLLTAIVLAIGGIYLPAAAQTLAIHSSPQPPSRPIAEAQPVPASAIMSPRPMLRPAKPETIVTEASAAGFQNWINGFVPRARRQGISDSTLRGSLTGITYDSSIIRLDGNQSEFSKQLWEYLDSAVSSSRIANGRAGLTRYATTLDQIERKYGVDKEVVVAIWGLESAYGSNRGSTDVISALATLAYDGRRGAFFEEQLVAALKIVQAGDISPRAMKGSWAGAMGHTQFMPTSYLDHAVDFRGDGRRDIWSDDPTDALASTAAYLAGFGWRQGHPWGVEVQLPQGFNYAQAGDHTKRSVQRWTQMGVRDMAGRAVPNYGEASILLPAGARGPAFMIFNNFEVLERYNAADSYVIAVGHLSDRLKGGPGIRASWPRGDRSLKLSERKELQQRLSAAGFSTKGIDGRIGPNTIEAIQNYQQARGLLPDGYPSYGLLQHMR
ncbi:lytic murein transglycosylase [Qingshengfaniella alkalisoli]|uniref:Lytic murein transglycosylase n=1 Tax=Qingshengfaniella alkalisoli TaxID=2599296 RepID=A0A5B8IYQ8_9RHOB|nr:lytic murein transglycosylase [Qingshengfaniella alkalisoli]QDY71252.1 lytic murein transglycosylase [Qingshengfaniella alkalisoli]